MAAALLRAKLVDEIHWMLAPKLIGSDGRAALGPLGLNRLVEASLLRTPGMLYQQKEDNKISNLYNLKVINKTKEEIAFELKLLNFDGEIQVIGENELRLNAQGLTESVLFILLNADDLKSMKIEVEVGLFSNGEMIDQVETNFMGPAK